MMLAFHVRWARKKKIKSKKKIVETISIHIANLLTST